VNVAVKARYYRVGKKLVKKGLKEGQGMKWSGQGIGGRESIVIAVDCLD
jgi:hypothetical protein